MAKRDVELVIKARNEASKAIESITSALDDLTKSQVRVSSGSEKTGSTLSRLGDELKKLTGQLSSATGVDRLATSMDRAEKAVSRLEQSVTKTAEDAVRLDAEFEQAGAAVAKFAAEAERMRNILAQQKQTVAESEAEYRKLSGELKVGEAAIAGAASKSQQYVDSIGRQEAALAKTASKHRELAQAILSSDSPSAKLIDNFEKTDAKLRKHASTLGQTRSDFEAYRATISQLSADMPKLREAAASASAAFASAQGAEKATAANLLEVDRASKTATAEFYRLQDAVAKNAATLTKEQGALVTAKANLLELANATDTARRKAAELDAAAFNKVASGAAEAERMASRMRDLAHAFDQAEREGRQFGDMYFGTKSAMATASTTYGASAQHIRAVGVSSREAAVGLGEMENKGRAAMTWAQRLKGEVIALALSFGGLYAAVGGMRTVLKTVMDMDAAQTRLGVAFGDNQATIGKEMSFVQQQADRLGISVKVLSTEYSKLAIATKDTSLAGSQTRQIFVSLAESFRVANMSQNQMELAFNAITQMVNKGTVSMEELRQQLGEQLPSAFNLAAKAMGLTTAEFSKLVAEGKIATTDFLPKFAETLKGELGSGLPKALQNIAADVGKFENAVVKAQQSFAKGGFTKGLQDGLRELTRSFESADAQSFFTKMGMLAGELIKVLAKIPNVAQEISTVFAIVAAGKLVNYFGSLIDRSKLMVDRFRAATAAAAASSVQYDLFGKSVQESGKRTKVAAEINALYVASVSKVGPTMAAAAVQTRVLTVATQALNGALNIARGLFAAFGGWAGLITTGLTVAFTYWIGKTNEVIDATGEHQRQMDALLQAYDKAKDKAGDWAKEVKGVSLLGAQNTTENLRKQLKSEVSNMFSDIETSLGRLRLARGDWGDAGKEIFSLMRQFESGDKSVADLVKRFNELGSASSSAAPEIKKVLNEVGNASETARAVEQDFVDSISKVEALGGSVEGVSPAQRRLVRNFEDIASGADGATKSLDQIFSEADKKLKEQLETVKSKIPELVEESKMLDEMKSIDESLETAAAIQGLDKTSDEYKKLLELAQRAKTELRQSFDAKRFKGLDGIMSGADNGADASAKLLRKFEGFKATPYWDVNAFRVGFGSDTVTLADGTIQKVVQGVKVSVEDANRDLVRRIGDFQATVRGQIGSTRFDTFSNEQQAVLTSIAYNYGSLPERIVGAVRTGSAQQIATAIRGLSGDNKGVNAGRREKEAFIFENGNSNGIERQVELETKRAEKAKEYLASLNEQLDIDIKSLKAKQAAQDVTRSGQEQISRDEAIILAVEQAQLKAKKDKQALTDTELEKIREKAGLLWDIESKEKAQAERQRLQTEGEQKINQLQQLRRDLLQQMQFAQENGDDSKVRELAAQVDSVDVRLKQAIASMREFWSTSSDPDAREAALASLDALEQGLQKVGEKTELTAKDFGNLFGENLQSAWSGFLSKVRETGDVFGSLRDSFKQFASDFLLQMAQMIAKVALLNALKGLAGSGGFMGQVFAGFGVKLHDGGIVGSGGTATAISPAWFQNAVRYHTGGIAGLKPNEVPAVLEKGEEVLTAGDPRHSANAGAGSNVKIINAIDSGSVVSEGMSTAEGERAFVNFIRANKGMVKQILG